MSTSTDAILFYGYCWDDEVEWHSDIYKDGWEKRIALKRGHKDPWDGFPEISEDKILISDKWVKEKQEAIDAWSDLIKEISVEFGCHIDIHCSDNCQIPYIAINGSVTRASRGYPRRLDLWPKAENDWDEKINKFCNELEIELPEQQLPGWWLVSYWG